MPGEEKPAVKRGRKPNSETVPVSKATPESLSTLIMALFYLYGQSRPEPVRSCWIFSENELAPVSVPAAKILNRIGGKALQSVMLIADPVSLLLGVHGLIEEGKRRENALFIQFLNTNPEAAAKYSEFLRRQQQRRNGREQPAPGNDPGDFAEYRDTIPVTGPASPDDTADHLPRN